MLPSWIKSKNNIPLPTYFFAILTTNLKFDSASFFLASSSPARTPFASSISCSYVKSGILPISLKYILTGSSTLTPSILFTSISSNFISSTSSKSSKSGSSSSVSSLYMFIPFFSNFSKTSSICSGVTSPSSNASSPYVILPAFLAFSMILSILSCLSSDFFVVTSFFVSDFSLLVVPFSTFSEIIFIKIIWFFLLNFQAILSTNVCSSTFTFFPSLIIFNFNFLISISLLSLKTTFTFIVLSAHSIL